MESTLLRKEIGQCAIFRKVLGVMIPTFGCIVKISKTRPVDNRRSSSTTGIFNVIDGGLRPREVWAVSLDDL